MLDRISTHWLAGLLEGEGTFLHGPPSRPRSPVIALVMTDQDVVERVGKLWDRAVVAVPPREPHHKPPFATRIRGAMAAEWMRGLYPLLGQRRQDQVDRALTDAPSRKRWRRPTTLCTVEGCGRPGARRGLCLRHYDRWWKARSRGRQPTALPVDPPRPLPPVSECRLDALDPAWVAWLAGLLEGEGTFASSGTYPVISAQMCDLDVLQRAASLMGIAKVSPRDDRRSQARGWSPSFSIAIGGTRAAAWMRKFEPHMGARRTRQIDRALAIYRPIRLTNAPVRCVVPGCPNEHRGRGLCHKHYMTWSRDRKAGKAQRITPLR